MKTTSAWMLLAPAVLLIAACNGGGSGGPGVRVDELGTGAYVVSTGSADAPSVGRYYAGADGSRLLVLDDGDDKARQLYRRDAGGDWIAVPRPADDVSVSLLHSDGVPVSAPDFAALAGRYVTQLPDGSVAAFSLAADGRIVAGSTVCKLSGTLATSTLPGALKLTLTASSCGSLPASSSGVLTIDSDYAPARFRLLSDDSKAVADLWAYAE